MLPLPPLSCWPSVCPTRMPRTRVARGRGRTGFLRPDFRRKRPFRRQRTTERGLRRPRRRRWRRCRHPSWSCGSTGWRIRCASSPAWSSSCSTATSSWSSKLRRAGTPAAPRRRRGRKRPSRRRLPGRRSSPQRRSELTDPNDAPYVPGVVRAKPLPAPGAVPRRGRRTRARRGRRHGRMRSTPTSTPLRPASPRALGSLPSGPTVVTGDADDDIRRPSRRSEPPAVARRARRSTCRRCRPRPARDPALASPSARRRR